jgi:hypothetical protein
MTENVVLEILRGLKTDIAGLKTDIAGLTTDVAELRRQGNIHARTLDILSQDTRMIGAAVNDIAPGSMSPLAKSRPCTTISVGCGLR